MRLRGKVDANHAQIVRELRQLGYSVLSSADLGSGAPDVIVGHGGAFGVNVLVEIKDSNQPPSKRKLTDDEKEFHAAWRGPIIVAERTEDVVEFIREYLAQ